MGKVRKPPPTPMMDATIPLGRRTWPRREPEIFLPPGTKSSSNVIRGGPWPLCSFACSPASPEAISAGGLAP